MIYFIKRFFLRKLYKLIKSNPAKMPMVKYWRHAQTVKAKVTTGKDGAQIMYMEGEDYPFPGFPRSYLLHGSLSKLKHEIKNRLFNDSWYKLEAGITREQVISDFKNSFDSLIPLIEAAKFDMVPPSKMSRPARELWRSLSAIEQMGARIEPIKKVLTFILNEDDAYRFRLQWLISIFNPSSWWFKLLFRDVVHDFELALQELEHAEIVGDMKERIRLLRRILMLILEDKKILTIFKAFCRETNWQKLKLDATDKYNFRAKYFKVDLDRFEY